MSYLDPASYELPFAHGSETSEAAARKAAPFVGRQGREVLMFLRRRGEIGATQPEACAELNLGRPSACARFHALEQQELIQKTRRRRQHCTVYEVVR